MVCSLPCRDLLFSAPQSQYVSDIKTSVIYQNGAPAKIVLDYVMSDPANSKPKKDQATERLEKTVFSSEPADK